MPDLAVLVTLNVRLAHAVALAAQLGAAEIMIEVTETSVIVEARYRLTEPRDSLRLTFIAFPGQDLEPLDPDPATSSSSWDAPHEPTTITVPVSQSGSARLRYRVTGPFARIPIPVPRVPAAPGAAAVTFIVRGLDREARLREGFPRLARRTDGSAVAQLDNVPSLLRLPSSEGTWSVNRAAQAFVLLLLAGAGAAWAFRARRRTGAPAA
jgi:hypothetical protein